jgi:hypothetical protein
MGLNMEEEVAPEEAKAEDNPDQPPEKKKKSAKN